MKKQTIFAFILSLSLVASIFAHDLFLKTDSYFLKPNSKFTVKVMNGTFMASEGAVAFESAKRRERRFGGEKGSSAGS